MGIEHDFDKVPAINFFYDIVFILIAADLSHI
jgi:hypothetical protein